MKLDIERRKEISATILKQLGGNRFIAMTGTHNMMFDEKGALFLRFRGSRKANHVRIELNARDLYNVEFTKIGRAPKYNVMSVFEHTDIYCDQLQEIFEQATGLFVHF